MERLNVKTLLLELTRNCNLECKHCFRGDSQNTYMDLSIIDYIFDNVCRINEFLITGGEPFLAKAQLEQITKNIMKDRTNVGKVVIVTNGTILSFDILGMLHQINKRTNLEIRLSNDIFHLEELKNKNLMEKRDMNLQILNDLFNVIIPEDKIYVVHKIGRAENLTEDDIININNIDSNKTKYIIGTNRIIDEYRKTYPLPILMEDNVVSGTLNIDVFGNITPTYYSFYGEDRNICSSVKKHKSLKLAIENIDKSLV